ncbi:MAG TPA: phosphatidylserine decarboxylase family protein [Ignavibacteriales bacterium]|nr:phosphatidylserine decarboxylase family protein [Ignavibacteriales bacterium]
MFTHYGTKTIINSILFSIVLIIIGYIISYQPLRYLLIMLAVLFILFTLYFFRDPDRQSPTEENIIVSPADGKVLCIKKVKDDLFLNEECYQLSIFMSPLNVHVNRIPISGEVKYLNYVKGKYLVASHDKASLENERNYIGIVNDKYGKVLFSQVAGTIARRIVCNLKLDEKVTIGDRFGMIKFGSRVDVYVPLIWQPKVKEGDDVVAGVTKLFEVLKNDN